MDKASVLIADDHPIFRSGLRAVIESAPSFQVVGEASDGEEAVRMASVLRPEIVVLDYNMPELNGFEVLKELAKLKLASQSIMLTMHNEEAMFAKAFELGVRGYVLKDSASVDIINCLHAVSKGQIYASPAVTTFLYKRASRPEKTAGGIGSLTPSERMILRLISDYKTSREIAEELGVSVRTIENHRANIAGKLGIQGNHALFKFAFENRSDLF